MVHGVNLQFVGMDPVNERTHNTHTYTHSHTLTHTHTHSLTHTHTHTHTHAHPHNRSPTHLHPHAGCPLGAVFVYARPRLFCDYVQALFEPISRDDFGKIGLTSPGISGTRPKTTFSSTGFSGSSKEVLGSSKDFSAASLVRNFCNSFTRKRLIHWSALAFSVIV